MCCLFWYRFIQQVPPELVGNILSNLDMNSKIEDVCIISTQKDCGVSFHSGIIQSAHLVPTQRFLNF